MEANDLARTGKPAGNTATAWLKIIALVFMFCDHAGKMLLPNIPEMRLIGRIAFPIYVWCMIVGFHYTRSVPKYLLRVLGVGLISQPLYILALNHTWRQPNVFLCLFLGLCALWGIREKKYLSHIWAPAAAIVLATLLNADYGWKGVLPFVLLYAVRDSRRGIAAVMVAYFLFWGSFYSVTKSFFNIPFDLKTLDNSLYLPLASLLRTETYALLSLPFILVRFRKDLKFPRWVGYAVYPAHLVLLYVLELIFK
ncbi:MAG: conjugal transfer protein TraX [Clostridiales bacterium]|nr:conjugal transfer protein TraX [Clostridiales bacterium]